MPVVITPIFSPLGVYLRLHPIGLVTSHEVLFISIAGSSGPAGWDGVTGGAGVTVSLD